MSSALTLSQGLPGINKRLKRTRTRLMACVPIDGTSQPFLQRNSCTEIKITFGTRYIECPPRLPVKLRCVPNDFPFVTGEPCGQKGKILDADFLAAADIDRLRTVVAFGRQQDRFSRIFDV